MIVLFSIKKHWFLFSLGIFIVLAFLFTPLGSLRAQGGAPAAPGIPDLLSCGGKLDCLVNKIIKGLIALATPLVALMVLIAGIQMMTAAGNAEKVKKARLTILYAAIGYAVILLAWVIVLIVQDILGGTP